MGGGCVELCTYAVRQGLKVFGMYRCAVPSPRVADPAALATLCATVCTHNPQPCMPHRTGVVIESAPDEGAAAKRKREEAAQGGKGGKGGAVSAEEAEALARREAARQRVAQRTAAGFGYA